LIEFFHRLITARNRTAKALVNSEADLQAILNTSLQGFILLDQNRLIREFNKRAYEDILKIVQLELKKGQPIERVIAPSKLDAFSRNFEKALQGETTVAECNFSGPDGSDNWYEFNYAPVWQEEGKIGGVCLGLVSINARKKVQERVERSEARFRSMVQNSQDIITILSEAETIRYASPAIERLLGYPPEAITGQSFSEFIHPDDMRTVQETLARTKAGAGTVALV
jgi:PAS domain S-box-containing protein